MLAQLTLKATDPNLSSKTLQLLEEQGVLVISDYLSKEELNSIHLEYEKILKTENNSIVHLEYPQGKAKKIIFPKLDPAEFPATKKVFNHTFMKDLAAKYLGKPNLFNHEIYVAKDEHEEINALNELHYDKISTLKFFLYINDIDKSNGAFEAVPGSHKLAQSIMNFYTKRGKKIVNLPNRNIPDSLNKPLAIEASAGSLIIFTTDTYHRAGRVEKGKNRMVMRGHSRRKPMPKFAPSILSKQWFNESFLNPAKYYYGISELINPKKPY